MKSEGYRRVLPVYGAALIWLLYCRFFPLYLPLHFLIVIALSAGAGVLLYMKLPFAGGGEPPARETDVSATEEITAIENKEN
jgi:hypothetical protein